VKQLKGISGPSPTWENGRLILSTPDAIGQALDDYLNHRPQHKWEIVDNDAALTSASNPDTASPPEDGKTIEESSPKTMTTCPRCGGTVIHENGCITCPGCGYSRC
jgi:ribonucleoside-diphosphate reductase alpha chain